MDPSNIESFPTLYLIPETKKGTTATNYIQTGIGKRTACFNCHHDSRCYLGSELKPARFLGKLMRTQKFKKHEGE